MAKDEMSRPPRVKRAPTRVPAKIRDNNVTIDPSTEAAKAQGVQPPPATPRRGEVDPRTST